LSEELAQLYAELNGHLEDIEKIKNNKKEKKQ